MAILLVKIENENSLAFNEFFDYAGFCYASSRSREKSDGEAIDLSTFYEATVSTQELHDVPVVFARVEDDRAQVIGWYQKAEIWNQMYTPSLFLEGNIRAYSSDVIWLPEEAQTTTVRWFVKSYIYEVIEEEDARFAPLRRLMNEYGGKNRMMRYHTAETHTIPAAMKDISSCKAACEQWAGLVTAEECQDIRDLKTLEAYAKKLCEKDRKDPDGYYYQALACYHLGFVKEGLKQMNKALQLEPEASDLLALKGLLLVSKGYVDDGAMHLHKAYEKSEYEGYLLMEGRAYMMFGKVDRAYDCFQQTEDESLLEAMGIKLNDMENRWSSIKLRYMKLKDMFRKKS
ncbi:MAG: hypothetical protein Q4E53_05040 [Eubacteriales bacterium]|nr:hypothetical protein [Eubacteriales bacterium]